jgi:hypothetical protein
VAGDLYAVRVVGEERSGREAFALIRLHVLAEGETEEGFVNEVLKLAPELVERHIFVDVHRITTGRRHGRQFRGGFVKYEHLARDLTLWMKEDQNEDSWFTTMIDLHRLPTDFPGSATVSSTLAGRDRVTALQAELSKDMLARLGNLSVGQRLIPYIQLHEFEALLFSDPQAFLAAFPGAQSAVSHLTAIRRRFRSPEDIDTPSRHILSVLQDYDKPASPLIIAKQIGLPTIRSQCPHFDDWLSQLLALADVQDASFIP